jgi:hypothetical protein
VAGPLVGGALVAVSGASLVFAVNAATFAVSGLLIALTSGIFGGHQQRLIGGAHPTRELFTGFRLIVSNKQLAPLAIASSLAYASFGAALVIDPALSRYLRRFRWLRPIHHGLGSRRRLWRPGGRQSG